MQREEEERRGEKVVKLFALPSKTLAARRGLDGLELWGVAALRGDEACVTCV